MHSKFIALFIFAFVVAVAVGQSQPYTYTYTKRFDSMSGVDYISICLNNCAQCKEALGEYFLGKKCQEACFQMRGRAVPDCDRFNSMAPLITVS